MGIAVLANNDQWNALRKAVNYEAFYRIADLAAINTGTTACIILDDDTGYDLRLVEIPVLLNAVCVTLKEMNAPLNIVRINGWNGFLDRNTWEVAGQMNDAAQAIFTALGKQIITVPDEPGFVTARIIAMIINEAYFALADQVSTREEIDIAMKLGTNYPYGPFEWAELIGTAHILALLQKLSIRDKRYVPAPLLKGISL